MAVTYSQNGVIVRSVGSSMEGIYLKYYVPEDSFGEDGEYTIVINKIAEGDCGTIIPVQVDDSNCAASDIFTSLSAYPYKAFDNNYNSFWSTNDNGMGTTGWIRYDFGENNKKKITSVGIYPRVYGSYRQLGSCEIQASDDTNNWTTLAAATIPNGDTEKWFTFVFNNDAYYRYYRLYATSTNGLTVTIKEIHMNDVNDITLNYGYTFTPYKKINGTWVSKN